MKLRLFLIAPLAGLAASGSPASGRAPIHNPVFLNIGIGCQWQKKCMDRQQKAMKRALGFVRKKQPPSWRIHLCNRNASRNRARVDWIGFNNCIRNAALQQPPPPPPRRKATRRATVARGERG
jgi:hypothetical protein